MKKRILSIVLSIVMLMSMMPVMALAAESDIPDTVCDECGETEGIHLESCSSYTGSEEGGGQTLPECTCGADDGNHAEDCPLYEVPVDPQVDEATYQVRALIDALPSVEELSEMPLDEQGEYYNLTLAANEAYQALSDDQKAQLAEEKEKLDELFAYFASPQLAMPAPDGTNEHSHCVCGGSISVGGHTHDTDAPAWTAWGGTTSLAGGGSYYLSGDVTVTETITLSGAEVVLNLCLNGHVLKLDSSSSARVIHVERGATLNLCDCNSTTTHTFSVSDSGLWTLKEGEAGENDKTLRGGVITGGRSSGVYVSYSRFHMYGGNIAGNFAPSNASYGGGGVCIYESIGSGGSTEGGFLMYGGAICGNVSEKGEGGGIYLHNSVGRIFGGTISDNAATTQNLTYGGGVYLYGSSSSSTVSQFFMTGGRISNNTAKSGGGVYLGNTSFEMSGGEISGNTTTSTSGGGGGGVYLGAQKAVFTLSGGTIGGMEEGKANISSTGGGGVNIVNGTMNMTGGKICGNQTTGTSNGGGGVRIAAGTLNMSDGEISGNTTASNGGGVYVDAGTNVHFLVSGTPVVSGNKKGTDNNNIYLPRSAPILTVEAPLTEGAYLGMALQDLVGNVATAEADYSQYFESDVSPDNRKSYYRSDEQKIIIAYVRTVTFHANDGTDEKSTQKFIQNVEQALAANTFTRDGYDFTGWTVNANGTGTAYTDGQNVTLSGNLTLYAQWKEKPHSHCVCGGSISVGGHPHDTDAPVWTAWNGTDEISYNSDNTAYVYLSDNVERTDALEVGDGYTLNLCLNGKTLTSSASNAITVDGTLSICDCGSDGRIIGTKQYGQIIQTNKNTAVLNLYGGGIEADGNGIENCIYVFKGTANLYGGKLTNTSGDNSYGLSLVSKNNAADEVKANLYGTTISASSAAVKINTSAIFNMSGGSAEGTGANGRGLYIAGGEPTITGGTISGNQYGVYAAPMNSSGTYIPPNISISGAPEISNIYVNNQNANFVITIGTLTGNHIYTVDMYTPGVFSSGGKEYVSKFVSGRNGYVVVVADDNLKLATAYTITVGENGIGGTASASATLAAEGTEITLTATPDAGYSFKEWQVDYPVDLTITENKFTMPNGDVRVNAEFEATAIAPTITTTSLPDGTVDSAYSASIAATGDTPITWSIDSGSLPTGLSLDQNTGTISGTPTSDGTFTFTVKAQNSAGNNSQQFTIEIYPKLTSAFTISVSADPAEGGTANGGGTYNADARATVTATAKDGYRFVKWTENGIEVSTDAVYSFAVTADRTLVAVFEREPVNPPIYTAPSITAQPQNKSIKVGETATFTVAATGTPEPTYQWQIDRGDGSGWVDISGATQASYTTGVVSLNNSGYKYRCVITNSAGSVTSSEALLTVTEDGGENIIVEPKINEDFDDGDIPQALKDEDLDTVEKIDEALELKIESRDSDIENTELYDVVLMYSTDGGATWTKADESHFPASGKLPVQLPVPDGTDPATHEYIVAHMFTSDAFDKTPGDVEYPDVTEKEINGKWYLEFYVTGLSPISIGWKTTGTTPVTTYTVTYTDGVGGAAFANQVYDNLTAGTPTPAFNGTPTRDGFTFTGWNPSIAATVTADATYTAQWNENSTPVVPNPENPPVITSPTTDQKISVYVGNKATMSIKATGADSYQWYVDRGNGFEAISGATSASYTTSAASLENDGYRYYCVAINAYGTDTSPIFTLKVLNEVVPPKTGDNSQTGLWIGLMMIAIAGLITCAVMWRKRRYTR